MDVRNLNQEKVISIFMMAAIAICCSYQCISVTNIYYSYPMEVSVMVDFKYQHVLPAMTFAIKIENRSAVNRFLSKYPPLKNRWKSEHLSKDEQINELLYPLWFKCGFIRTEISKHENCSLTGHTSLSYYNKWIYVTFFERSPLLSKEKGNEFKITSFTDATFSEINFGGRKHKSKYVRRLCVSLHAPYSFSAQSLQCFTAEISSKSTFALATFKETTTKLLKKPFASKCIVYTEIGFKSRINCIKTCMQRNLKKRTCITFCCDADCTSQVYSLSMQTYGLSSYNFFCLQLRRPRGVPSTRYELIPQFTASFLIVYIASTASLWYGFSIYMSVVKNSLLPLFIKLQSLFCMPRNTSRMKSVITSRNAIRNYCIFVAVICFSLHLNSAVITFLEQQTVLIVELNDPKSFYLPSVSIGEPITTNINHTLFCKYSKEYCHSYFDSRHPYLSYLKSKNNVLFIKKCVLFVNHFEKTNCSSSSGVVKSSLEAYFVHTFFFNERLLLSNSKTSSKLVYIEVDTSDTYASFAVAHPSFELPSVRDITESSLLDRRYRNSIIKELEITEIELKKTASGDCGVYGRNMSQKKCVDACVGNLSLQICNFTVTFLSIRVELLKMVPRQNEECFRSKKITQLCVKECSKILCEHRLYGLRNAVIGKTTTTNLIITIMRPQLIKKIYQLYKYAAIDTVNELVGIILLWIGLSLFCLKKHITVVVAMRSISVNFQKLYKLLLISTMVMYSVYTLHYFCQNEVIVDMVFSQNLNAEEPIFSVIIHESLIRPLFKNTSLITVPKLLESCKIFFAHCDKCLLIHINMTMLCTFIIMRRSTFIGFNISHDFGAIRTTYPFFTSIAVTSPNSVLDYVIPDRGPFSLLFSTRVLISQHRYDFHALRTNCRSEATNRIQNFRCISICINGVNSIDLEKLLNCDLKHISICSIIVVNESCYKSCIKNECVYTKFELISLLDSERGSNIKMQQWQSYTYNYKFKYSFIDFLIYISNIVSIFVGFSFYDLYLKIMQRIYTHRPHITAGTRHTRIAWD